MRLLSRLPPSIRRIIHRTPFQRRRISSFLTAHHRHVKQVGFGDLSTLCCNFAIFSAKHFLVILKGQIGYFLVRIRIVNVDFQVASNVVLQIGHPVHHLWHVDIVFVVGVVNASDQDQVACLGLRLVMNLHLINKVILVYLESSQDSLRLAWSSKTAPISRLNRRYSQTDCRDRIRFCWSKFCRGG